VLSTLIWDGDVVTPVNGVGSNAWTAIDGVGNTNWKDQATSNPSIPANGDTLIFPAVAGQKANNNTTAAGNSYFIQFTGDGYSISGAQITLTDQVSPAIPAISDSGGDNAIHTPLALGGATAFDVATGTLTQDGVISGSGSLTKKGAGSLSLAGANTYGGVTNVDDGILTVPLGGTLGSAAGETVVNEPGQLRLDGGVDLGTEPLTLKSRGVDLGGGAFTGGVAVTRGTVSLSGPITVAANSWVSVPVGASTFINGAIGGVAGVNLVYFGGGTNQYSGTNDNTFAGNTRVFDGLLQLDRGGHTSIAGPLFIGDGVGVTDSAIVTTFVPG
jgi:autotransporter-associated beta strand protein